MQSWHVAKEAGGCLTLLCALLLSGPGMRAVRAEEDAQGSAPVAVHGPACRADTPIASLAAVQSVVERLRREAPSREQRAQIVALDNRGHNYGPPPSVAGDLEQFDRELRRERGLR